jgi:hypothetical protein
VWDVADLAPGEGGTITITAALDRTFGGVLTNRAAIANAIGEARNGDNTDVWATSVKHRVYLPLVLR